MSQLAQHCITVRLDGMTWTHLLHYGYHLMNVRFYTFCGAYYLSFSQGSSLFIVLNGMEYKTNIVTINIHRISNII
jgi:hypothetical protein